MRDGKRPPYIYMPLAVSGSSVVAIFFSSKSSLALAKMAATVSRWIDVIPPRGQSKRRTESKSGLGPGGKGGKRGTGWGRGVRWGVVEEEGEEEEEE